MTDDTKKKESLRFSFWDGVFASGMMGFTTDYFTPFLLLLGAGARQVGMLAAFPNLFGALVQFKSADIAERLRSRKKVITAFIFLQALMLLPMALMAFFGIQRPYLFIALVVLFTLFGALSISAWSSLMSDLVAENKRGEYFGWRNNVLGLILVAAMFLAGVILNLMKNRPYAGFTVIFAAAFLFRLISWFFLTRQYEPPLTFHREHHFNFIDFITRLKDSNFAKFAVYVSLMSFSVNICSPFFSVLMLKDLRFSYLVYTVVVMAATLTIFLTIARWGRHADRVGNLKIIKFTSPLVAIIPLFWIINNNPVYLILIQVWAGFLWSGFNLCSSNFIYDAVTPEKRTRCISYFNALNGLAICCGALIGGFLLQRLPPIFGKRFYALFLLSALLRISVSVFGRRSLKEVRDVKEVRNHELFYSMIGIRPILDAAERRIE